MTHNMAKFVQFICDPGTKDNPRQAYNDHASKVGIETMTAEEASGYSKRLGARFRRERRRAKRTGVDSTWEHYDVLARRYALMKLSKQRKRRVKRKRESEESETVTAPNSALHDSDSVGCSDVPDPTNEPRATKRQRPLCAFTEPAIHMLVGVESLLKNAETEDDLQQLRLEEAMRRCSEVIAAVERLSDA